MGNDKNTRKHNIQESLEVSPFPAGDHKAAGNRQGSITKTSMKHKKTKETETVSKNTGGLIWKGLSLSMFNGTNPTLNYDVDQDT